MGDGWELKLAYFRRIEKALNIYPRMPFEGCDGIMEAWSNDALIVEWSDSYLNELISGSTTNLQLSPYLNYIHIRRICQFCFSWFSSQLFLQLLLYFNKCLIEESVNWQWTRMTFIQTSIQISFLHSNYCASPSLVEPIWTSGYALMKEEQEESSFSSSLS